MQPDNVNRMITTWETRFCPHILQLAKMSRLPKIQQMYKELYKEPLDLLDDDESDGTLPNSSPSFFWILLNFEMTWVLFEFNV